MSVTLEAAASSFRRADVEPLKEDPVARRASARWRTLVSHLGSQAPILEVGLWDRSKKTSESVDNVREQGSKGI